MQKRIHVRLEHLRLSSCRKAFVERIKENDKRKEEGNKKGEHVSTKRVMKGPKEAFEIAKPDIQLLNPKFFLEIV